MRGDLVSEDGTVTAIVVCFDEARDRRRARRRHPARSTASSIRSCRRASRAHYNGSLEISETYNRITLDNQTKFTPPILLSRCSRIYVMFRSWRKTLLTLFAILISMLWTLGLYACWGSTTTC